MKTLTLIGANGFVGKSLLEYAEKKQSLKSQFSKIILISRSKIKRKRIKKIFIKYIQKDINEFKVLPKTDFIIYAINSNNFKKDIKSLKKFISLINSIQKKTKILFTSSGAVYGSLKGKKDYIRIKKITEKSFQKLGKDGYKVSIARLFSFIGKYILENKNYAISDFINSAIKNRKIIVRSKFQVYRSYMHSDDLINWLITILRNSSEKCPIYNVGSDEKVSLNKLANLVGKKFGAKVIKSNLNSKRVEKYIPTINKTQKKLNLKIKYNLKKSLDLVTKNLK